MKDIGLGMGMVTHPSPNVCGAALLIVRVNMPSHLPYSKALSKGARNTTF